MDGPAGGTRAQLSSDVLLLQEPGPGPSEGWAALWVDVGPGSHPRASPDQGAGRACLLGRRGHSGEGLSPPWPSPRIPGSLPCRDQHCSVPRQLGLASAI